MRERTPFIGSFISATATRSRLQRVMQSVGDSHKFAVLFGTHRRIRFFFAACHLGVRRTRFNDLRWGMPTFRCDFEVTGDLVLPDDSSQLNLTSTDGFELTIRNLPADITGHTPALSASVVGPADSIDTARQRLSAALATQLDLLSFVTRFRFKISAPRWLMEWDDWQRTRQLVTFHATDPRHPPVPDLAQVYLDTVAAVDKVKPPDFLKIALRYFRYGLLDQQTEDQFMRFWLALEIIAENVKERDRVPIMCPACNTALKCGQCGVEPTRVPMAKQAIENLIVKVTGAAAPTISKRLFKARNGLMHGQNEQQVEAECNAPLPQIVNELGAIAWKAILLSIPLGEGPRLAFGNRDGEFVIGSMVMGLTAIFEHSGDGAHPVDDQIPKIEIAMDTNFRASDETG